MPTQHEGAPGLRVTDLRHSYGKDQALTLPTWDLAPGGHCLVRGPSGSGKTTLLHAIAGLVTPSAGTIALGNTEITALAAAARDRFRARHIGLIPQTLHLIPAITVADNLRLARRLAGLDQDEARLRGLLDRLGLAALADRRPKQLSQGQAQRAAIARALVNAPRLLLADEPTAALDDENARAAADLLRDMATAQDATLIVASHDNRVSDRFDAHLVLPTASPAETVS